MWINPVTSPKMSDNNLSGEATVQAYLRAYARLSMTKPGTPDFDIEQAGLETIWNSLTVEEKAEAHELAAPYRAKGKYK